jgi:hypothetical protein
MGLHHAVQILPTHRHMRRAIKILLMIQLCVCLSFGAFRTGQEVGRDGDSHGDTHMHLAKSESSQPRRVFLMDVEDELAKVEEEFYGSYQTTPEKKCFGNFVFTVI